MPARMQFDFRFSRPRANQSDPGERDAPFRILVLGDFTGRGALGHCDPQGIGLRPVLSLDIDNFDQVLSRLAPCVRLSIAGQGQSNVAIEFHSLDDFHPDRLYRELPIFRGLREIRARLLDPATFAQAAAELQAAVPGSTASNPPRAAGIPATAAEDDSSVLERLLGRKPSEPTTVANATPATAVDALIRRVVAPHVVPDAPPFQEQYVGCVDAAVADLMRTLLHQSEFQAIESAWRGVYSLASELASDERLQLCVLDISRAELEADFNAAGGDPERTQLYKRLVTDESRGLDAVGWSLFVGQYVFGRSVGDAHMLGILGGIASQAGAPFLGMADSSLAGCESLLATPDPGDWKMADDEAASSWRALRSSAVSPWLGLALPRLMLRLPYGAKTDPTEHVQFEESAPDSGHEAYLWGNPALGCALAIGRSFLDQGWGFEPNDRLEIGDLPAHIVERDGERRMQACAEVFLSERAGGRLLECGLMPLMSYRNRNAVRFLRIQSLAEPLSPLANCWA